MCIPGDHFILRSITPVTTLGGGRVIDPAPHKHGTGPRWHDRLVLLEEGAAGCHGGAALAGGLPAGPDPGQAGREPLPVAIPPRQERGGRGGPAGRRPRPAGGGSRERCRRRWHGAPIGRARQAPGGPGPRLFHGPSLLSLVEATLDALRRRADTDALNPYLTLGDLRRDLARGKEWPALDEALARLVAAGEVRRTEHGFVLGGGGHEPDAGQGGSLALLLAQFEDVSVPAETPSVAVAAEAVGLPPREAQKIVDALVRQGRLVRVGEDLYYPPDRLQALLDRLAGSHGSRRADDPGRSPRPARHLAALRPGAAGAHGLRGPDATGGGGAAPAAPPAVGSGAAAGSRCVAAPAPILAEGMS